MIGKDVVVVTRENNRGLLPGIRRDTRFTGTVIENPKWVSDDTVCLSTGLPAWARFPFRMILKSEIISMTEESGKAIEVKAALGNLNKKFKIKGSTGAVYTVTKIGSNWECTCTGFQFRRACKHITEAKSK